IAVGRLPVKSEAEALAAVEKIKRYDLAPETYTDWRNRIAFVGDDEDGNLHVNDANLIADDIRQQYPALNIDKIFLDAYPQESTSGGNRFPSVTEAINQSVFKGTLALTYLGHGSPRGWAQERVLTIPDIVNWQNRYRMPLLVTATCSFTAYDDPEFVSAGEEAFLNPNGGAIGLLTTVRAVFANQNAELTDRTLVTLFSRPDGAILTIGEAMQRAKNSFTGSFITLNSRKFTLIGDPSQRLAIPDLQVRTTAINGKAVTETSTDTLRALQQVRIEGEVVDFTGNRLENFNGILYPSIFDKVFLAKTLAQDRGSFPLDFQVQKNIIFNGRASVQNGRFAFTFVIPKDINYAFGAGKFSFYAAEDLGTRDASGSFQNISIGGNSTNQVGDDQGPQVDVFLNSTDFVFGNITGPEPVLYVQLTDDNGINVVGNSIGHDLEATLDENTQQIIVLNDFFSAALDDYTRGEVRYPLSKLSEGRHSIRVKAWDVANNPAEGYTEFVVASSAEIALEHVLNYPNPFTDRTCFQFDHNLPNQTLDVLIQIYTISGQLVKTIDQTIFSDGYLRRDDCIAWDGRDDFGDRLARGVYLYRVSVRANIPGSTELRGESKFEKLVLLK
ncbi:MAG: type IX secretion system sortase PorU, partial [Lewinellaceae bacterium]|nr:type IX secretion system sortase PorU [Lewinellaceae bacterium]